MTTTQEGGLIKILARNAGLFGCLSGIREILRCSSKCELASECSVVSPIKANYKGLFTFIVNLLKKLFDQLDLRYDELNSIMILFP